MYKVFTHEKPVFIASEKELSTIEGSFKKIKLNKKFNLKNFILQHAVKETKGSIIFAKKAPWKKFRRHFKKVVACGGLVVNDLGQILVIYRNGVWDLPKGKIEKGEKKKECAVREVEEECGINNVELIDKLITTYHTYEHKNDIVLKFNHWYLMRHSGNESLIPQTEEGITAVKWLSLENLEELTSNTFGSIKDVINEYLR